MNPNRPSPLEHQERPECGGGLHRHIDPLQETVHQSVEQLLETPDNALLERRRTELTEEFYSIFNRITVPPLLRTFAQRYHKDFPMRIASVFAYAYRLEQWLEDEEANIEHLDQILSWTHAQTTDVRTPKKNAEFYLPMLRFATQLHEIAEAKKLVEIAARLYSVLEGERGDVRDSLPLFDDPEALGLPYVDVASGARGSQHLAWLRQKRPLGRPVIFNDTAFFVQKNLEEKAALFEFSPEEFCVLPQNARDVPAHFPKGSIGTVKISDAGSWIPNDNDQWCQELFTRMHPKHGKIILTAHIPYEPDLDGLSWVDLGSFNEPTLQAITDSSCDLSVFLNTELLRKFLRCAEHSEWIHTAGSLDAKVCFTPNEIVTENGVWQLACVFTPQK